MTDPLLTAAAERIAELLRERDALRTALKVMHRRAQKAESELAKRQPVPVDTWRSTERQKEAGERDQMMMAVGKAAGR